MSEKMTIVNNATTDIRPRENWYQPESMEEAYRFAQAAVKSGLALGCSTVEQAFALIATGAELGLSPFKALRSIHNIKGKPCLSADLMVGLVKSSPVCEWFRLSASTNTAAAYETQRAGEPEPTALAFTIDDAKAAGLLNSGTWKKYPAAMLRARCSSALARAVYPDVVGGLYDPDEVEPKSMAEVFKDFPRQKENDDDIDEAQNLITDEAKRRYLPAVEPKTVRARVTEVVHHPPVEHTVEQFPVVPRTQLAIDLEHKHRGTSPDEVIVQAPAPQETPIELLRKVLPGGKDKLSFVPHLGTERAAQLHAQGVNTYDDLLEHIQSGQHVPGLGATWTLIALNWLLVGFGKESRMNLPDVGSFPDSALSDPLEPEPAPDGYTDEFVFAKGSVEAETHTPALGGESNTGGVPAVLGASRDSWKLRLKEAHHDGTGKLAIHFAMNELVRMGRFSTTGSAYGSLTGRLKGLKLETTVENVITVAMELQQEG